jgi:hypothetical protein
MTFKEFWDGPLTWAGFIIMGGIVFNACKPEYRTTNVHPDYIRDGTCDRKLTIAFKEAMQSGDWYTKGCDYGYLKATIYQPCQSELRQWYMKNHPEYNQTVRIK